MRYLFDNGLLSNNASEIASFFHYTRAKLSKTQIRHYLQVRSFTLTIKFMRIRFSLNDNNVQKL